ncbi:MAG: hypothetical protein M3Y13_06615, partial [Armatimonadota bacterium]|nr:hypothetical protein [Armatimonadota bacterium]
GKRARRGKRARQAALLRACLFRLPHYWGRGGPLLLLLFFACAAPLQAHPQVLVILADHLTLRDVTRPDLPNLARMRQEGHLALMSPGLAQKPDPVATVYATLGAGDTVRVGDVSQGRMAEALRRAGIRTALIGNADGDDTSPYRPALLFLPNPDVVSDGAVAVPTAPGGKREDPARLWAATQAALGTCDLVVVHFGDFARAERENAHGFLLPAAYQGHQRRALRRLDGYLGRVLDGFHGVLFVVVPTPSLMANGGWNSLTPFLTVGKQPMATLTSDTTQTPGLIAARDMAPTILAEFGVPAPLQMTGAEITPTPLSGESLGRMERLTRLNQEAQNPIFWTIGWGAALVVFGSLSLFLNGRMAGRAGAISRYGLRLVSAWPLALLLAPLANPHTVGAYIAIFAGLNGLLALLPSPIVICGLTAVVVVGDGLTGTTLISNSALSEYALSGIRFYGIGNEYMGMLIAGALLAAPLLIRLPRIGAGGLLLWFALVTFVLSFPSFGAKAGGAITATAAFVIAWRRLRGQPVTWKHLAGSIAAGFALVFVWALLSHALHLRRTHLETAVGALGQGRFGYIWGVSLRKIGLAGRVALHPGTLLGLMAFALLWGAARKFLWTRIAESLARDPRFAAVWGAGLWGCLVAVLFNDSGIVAAILMLQCLVLSLLHRLFREEEERNASAGA